MGFRPLRRGRKDADLRKVKMGKRSLRRGQKTPI